MLMLLMLAALGVGWFSGHTVFRLTRRFRIPGSPRAVFYARALLAWFAGFSAYAIVTETYRPILSLEWIREAILGGDLVAITLFSGFLAFASLRWWGPKSSSPDACDER